MKLLCGLPLPFVKSSEKNKCHIVMCKLLFIYNCVQHTTQHWITIAIFHIYTKYIFVLDFILVNAKLFRYMHLISKEYRFSSDTIYDRSCFNELKVRSQYSTVNKFPHLPLTSMWYWEENITNEFNQSIVVYTFGSRVH